MNFPLHFPAFPVNENQQAWPATAIAAHETISDIYGHAVKIARQEDSDPLRMAFHIDAITSDAIPILSALELEAQNGYIPLPHQWLLDSACLLADVVIAMKKSAEIGSRKEDPNVVIPELVHTVHTGKRGRPRKEINLDFLVEATSSHRTIKLQELADLMGIHRNTLRRHMKRHNVEKQYSNLSNFDLDTLIRTFKEKKPESGLQYVTGFLRKHGLRVQKCRVISSLKRIDGLGRVLRKRRVIIRKKYSVKRPHALWHLDGHHKMIRWGIVIHGFVDGFSRTVTAIRASTNNRALTVLDLFMDAVAEYGTPSRLRGDRGGENIACAIYMVMKKGPNRGSFMWGSSTRNTRIERLWVEVGTHFVRRWRAFFSRLERLHHLNVDYPEHLWLLHTLFLDAIKEDCEDFKGTWNNHPIQGEETRYKSPNDLRLMGEARFGVYRDECEDIHPDTINKYYGVDQINDAKRREPGAGNSVDEIESEEDEVDASTHELQPNPEELAQQIAENQLSQARHEGVPVTQSRNPFHDEEAEAAFFGVLEEVVREGIMPAGYGILPEELEDGNYPIVEAMRIGAGRVQKEVQILLEDRIWQERAGLWVQGLSVLSHFLRE